MYIHLYMHREQCYVRVGRKKSETNLARHGLSFEDAELVFEGPALTFEDTRFEYDEQRYVTFWLLRGRVVIIAHTPRGLNTRIISMRKATRREQKIYQKRLESYR